MTDVRPREDRSPPWAAQATAGDGAGGPYGGWQHRQPAVQDPVPGEPTWQPGLAPEDLAADARAEVGQTTDEPERNVPFDTVEFDLQSGWAALGFDTSEHGIPPVSLPDPAERPKKAAGRLAGIRRRFGWGLADQAVSSLTNFEVSLYVARSLGAAQFGAFSLAYVTYAFVLNASRGLATDPLLVRFSGVELPAWRRAVTSCTGTALAVGMVAGVSMLGAAVLLHGTSRVAFIAIGLTMPGLMLQDSWRYAFCRARPSSQAFLNDAIWALVMVPGLLALRLTGKESVFWFILVWGSAATVAAVVGPLQARVVPRLPDAWLWVSRHRDLAFRYLTENTSGSGAAQLQNLWHWFIGRAGGRRLCAGREPSYGPVPGYFDGHFACDSAGGGPGPAHLAAALAAVLPAAELRRSRGGLGLERRHPGAAAQRSGPSATALDLAASLSARGADHDRHHGPVFLRWRRGWLACSRGRTAKRTCTTDSVGRLRRMCTDRGRKVWRNRRRERQRHSNRLCSARLVVASTGGVARRRPEPAGRRGGAAPTAWTSRRPPNHRR